MKSRLSQEIERSHPGALQCSFVIASSIEDPNDRDRLRNHGICDNDAPAITDGPQSRSKIISRSTLERKIAQFFTKRHDCARKSRGTIGRTCVGDEVLKFFKLVERFPAERNSVPAHQRSKCFSDSRVRGSRGYLLAQSIGHLVGEGNTQLPSCTHDLSTLE